MPYKNREDRLAANNRRYQLNKAIVSAQNKGNPKHIARAIAWNRANPERVKESKRRRLCEKHGITLEQYNQAHKYQNDLCAVCQRPETKNQCLAIDHDHKHCPGETGCNKCFRGLLCRNCNLALGHFHDDRYVLEQAIKYITKGAAHAMDA